MSRPICQTIVVVCFLTCLLTTSVVAQIISAPSPNNRNPTEIVVSFPARITQVDGAAVPPDNVLPGPSIYFKEGGRRVYLTADARIAGAGIMTQVSLSNFRTLIGDHPVNLVTGSDEGGAKVPCNLEMVPCVA